MLCIYRGVLQTQVNAVTLELVPLETAWHVQCVSYAGNFAVALPIDTTHNTHATTQKKRGNNGFEAGITDYQSNVLTTVAPLHRGQKKVAVVEIWPLWGGMGVI